MKVKYDEAFEPLRNKHHGYTFIPSNYGNPAMSGQKNDRKRYELQWLRMQCNQKAVTQWRNMSAATKNAWSVFASTYPQPSKKDPNVFLSGYQLFVKRNTYKFLHEGIDSDFILEPELSVLPDPSFYVQINANGMCVDVSQWYLENFGLFPEIGQFVICRILPMAVNSGQFFNPLIATLEIDSIYIDGLFLSLFFNGNAPGVVFSVYLSKPVHAGRAYPSTKFRYMGCFKPTQFIQLTDTPDDYTGQAGKFVAVKATEDGVEFVDAGGGGLDCADLANCSIIENIISAIILSTNESIPAVNFGSIYQIPVVYSLLNISSSDDWIVPTDTIASAFRSYVNANGGASAISSPEAAWWGGVSYGSTNALKFNARGNGYNNNSGTYTFPGRRWTMIARDNVYTDRYYFYYLDYGSGNLNRLYQGPGYLQLFGRGIRLCNPSTLLSEGESGFYIGNDGRAYRTIVIDGVEWLADNLAESKWRDNSLITLITADADWTSYGTDVYSAPDYNSDNI